MHGFTGDLSFRLEVYDRILVRNDPVNLVDPWGLESVTFYSGGSVHLGLGGVSFLGGVAIDTNGKICIVSNVCGTVGPGIYGDLGFEMEVDSADLYEGESEAEGAFTKGGSGIVGGGSVTGNDAGVSASGTSVGLFDLGRYHVKG